MSAVAGKPVTFTVYDPSGVAGKPVQFIIPRIWFRRAGEEMGYARPAVFVDGVFTWLGPAP